MRFELRLCVFVLGALLTLWPGAAGAAPGHCPEPNGSTATLPRLDRLQSAPPAGSPAVSVTRDGRPVLAESCLPLRRGDLVATSASGTVLIQFAEGLVLLLPNTRVQIGSIWTFFGDLFSFGRVPLQDRYVTAGAEGTSYLFHTDAGGTTVTVLQGHVRVTPEQEASAAQRLESGQQVRVAPSAAPSLTRLTPAEVSEQLGSYQALTGYSAAELALFERAFTQLVGRPRNTASLLVEGSFSFGGGGAPIDIGAGSLAAAWSHRFPVLGSLQFGARGQGGATFGRYRSPMTDPETPGREEAATAGTARLPFHGAFAKLDAELGSNLGVVNLVGSLGLRGGWSHVNDVEGKADHFVWGPALSGRTEYPFMPGFYGIFELEFWVQRTPVAACPVGCTDPAQPRSPIWQAWLGLVIGVGVDL